MTRRLVLAVAVAALGCAARLTPAQDKPRFAGPTDTGFLLPIGGPGPAGAVSFRGGRVS